MSCTVDECCFFIPLQPGCVAIGVYNAISSVAKFSACVVLYSMDWFNAKIKVPILSVVSVYCALQMILAVLIIFGVSRRVLVLLKWSVRGLTVLAVVNALMVLSFFWNVKKERGFFAGCSVDVLLYYFAFVLFSYFVQLRRDQEHEEFSLEDQTSPAV